MPVREVCSRFKISTSTAYNINKACGRPPKKRGGAMYVKLTADIGKIIEDSLKADPTLTLKKLTANIRAEKGISISPSTIGKYLRNNTLRVEQHSFKVKRLFLFEQERNTEEALASRTDYIYKCFSYQGSGVTFIYVDEAQFCVVDQPPREPNTTISSRSASRRKKRFAVNVLTAVSSKDGLLHSTFTQAPVDGGKFFVFMQELVALLKTDMFRYAVVMSSSPTHNTESVNGLLNAYHIDAIYTAQMSWELSPIEYVLAAWKGRVALPPGAGTVDEVQECLQRSFAEIKGYEVIRGVEHVNSVIFQKVLRREPLFLEQELQAYCQLWNPEEVEEEAATVAAAAAVAAEEAHQDIQYEFVDISQGRRSAAHQSGN